MNSLPIDILGEITAFIKGDFIAWTSVCKLLNSFNTAEQRTKRSNHLLTLIKMYPIADWNRYSTSQNPNITISIVKENPDIQWSYKFLSNNPNITWEIVCDNPQIKWNYILYIQ